MPPDLPYRPALPPVSVYHDILPPPASYVIGVAFPDSGSVVSQSSLPVRLVEGAELSVEVRGGDEHKAARGHNGSAVILLPVSFMPLAASSGYSPSGIFQAYSPVFRLMALSVPQGGAIAGIAVRVEKFVVAGEPVLLVDRRGLRAGEFLVSLRSAHIARLP